MPLSDTTREAAEALVGRYPVARSALLPLLHLVQSDQGYVTDEGIAFCAEALGLTKAEVGAVATFYTMFKRQPVGDYLLSICTNPTCKIAGGQDIYEGYVEQLGGHHNAEDGVSVEHAECLGICDAAPVVQVNYEMYGPLTRDEADALLSACRKGAPTPSNWSNEVPRTFKEVEFELSGAADGVNDRLATAARAQVESEIPPSYRSGETDIPVTHPGGDPKGIGGTVLRERVSGGGTDAVPSTPRGGEVEHIAETADAGEPAAAEGVAGEGRGVAEERSDQAAAPTPASPSVHDKPEEAPKGETPVESAGDTPTATEQSQSTRRVADEATEQTVQGGPQTRTDEGQREADARADADPVVDGGAEEASAGTEPARDASQTGAERLEGGPDTRSAEDAGGAEDDATDDDQQTEG